MHVVSYRPLQIQETLRGGVGLGLGSDGEWTGHKYPHPFEETSDMAPIPQGLGLCFMWKGLWRIGEIWTEWGVLRHESHKKQCPRWHTVWLAWWWTRWIASILPGRGRPRYGLQWFPVSSDCTASREWGNGCTPRRWRGRPGIGKWLGQEPIEYEFEDPLEPPFVSYLSLKFGGWNFFLRRKRFNA